MRSLLIIVWLCLPVLFIAWHYGPGQELVAHDEALQCIAAAESAEAEADWQAAFEHYEAALAALPADATEERFTLRRLQSEAQIQSGKLIDGTLALEQLLADMKAAGADDSALNPVRRDIGKAYYHSAWLMRLEGASKNEWLPEVLQSRQQFRYLSERSEDQLDQENLEAAIKLQEIGLAQLKGMALPRDCPGNCENLSQRKREQRQSKGKGKGKGKDKKEGKDDARDKVKEQNQGEAAQMVTSGSGS